MLSIMRPLLYTLSVIALTLLTASAQRSIRLLYHNAPAKDALQELYLYGCNSDPLVPTKVKLRKQSFTRPILLSAECSKVYLLTAPLPADAQEIPAGTTAIDTPINWNESLALCFHSEKSSPLPLQIKTINASDDVFASGEIYWINLSKFPIKGSVGSQTISLAPSKSRKIKAPTDESEYLASIKYRVPSEDSPRTLIHQKWAATQSTKYVALVLNKPKKNQAGYKVLPIRKFIRTKE